MVYINTDWLDLNRQTVRTRVDPVTETVTAASLLLKELPLSFVARPQKNGGLFRHQTEYPEVSESVCAIERSYDARMIFMTFLRTAVLQ